VGSAQIMVAGIICLLFFVTMRYLKCILPN
jgi:hypothetical protein